MATAGIRVLLVDDHDDNREMYRITLGAAGFVVTEATGGREAMQIFDSGSFDVVVTDLAMPEIDGCDLTKAVRARDPDVIVIVVSAHTAEAAHERAREAGATAVCGKPCLPAALVKLIHEHHRR